MSNRHMPRIRARLTVSYVVEGDSMRRSVTADISPGGLFITAAQPPKAKSAITVHVQTADGGEIVLSGKVTWAKRVATIPGQVARSGFGVRLESAPEQWYNLLLSEDPDLMTKAP